MEQLTRRFIRLSEIPEKTSATQGDVMAAIEDSQLPLFAYVEGKRLGAYGTSDNQKVVYAVFDYQGMIQLKSKDAVRIIRLMKPTEISVLMAIELENITGWSSVDDVFPNIQKTNLHYTKQCPELPTTSISAIAELSVTATVENVVSKFASAFLNPEEDEKHAKIQDALLNLNINDSTAQAIRLNAKPVLINPEQLRVEVESINRWLSTIQPTSTVEPVKKSNAKLREVALSHPVEKVAYRVLETYGDQDAPQGVGVNQERLTGRGCKAVRYRWLHHRSDERLYSLVRQQRNREQFGVSVLSQETPPFGKKSDKRELRINSLVG
ncbi:hypothetical protein HJ149_22790 [Vibrio parahaemolyticus]|nr:hypothetical protein [Vibrio parahaemolyticus]